MAESELIEKLKNIGLTESKAKETLKNVNLTNNLRSVINSAEQHSNDLGGSTGNLLYNIASKTKAQISHQIPLLGEYVALKKIDSEVRLNAAIGDYCIYQDFLFSKNKNSGNILMPSR